MDCTEFNEYITEYEAKRLTKKQELEFLQHKNSCSECKEVFELVFGSEYENIEEVRFSFDDNICVSVMDKIQNIETNGYNIKLQNLLHLFFGVVIISLVLFILIVLEKGLNTILGNCWTGLNTVSDSLCNTLDMASHSLASAYLHGVVYIVLIFIFITFITSIYDYFKLKLMNKKYYNDINSK